MDPAGLATGERARPAVSLPVFEGPLDLLLHLVRAERVSIWDIPVARICDQYHAVLRGMETLDLEIAGEYLVCAAWLLALKSRLLLPRRAAGGEDDPRLELVERLVEYERVRAAADQLAGLEELRRGMETVALLPPVAWEGAELDLEELDLLALAAALRAVLERHQREHPHALDLPPMRFSVRDKIVELFEAVERERSFALLSYLLTRPDRFESVTLLLASLELVRLGAARAHQRQPFAEIFLTPTGKPLALEALGDV